MTLRLPRLIPRLDVKFWAKVEKTSTCWLWRGAIVRRWGYGMVARDGRARLSHRWSWVLANGKIPKDLCVLHKCDVPACVKPSHLFLGTNQDNVDDMMRKGRHRTNSPKGEDSHLAKLSLRQVKRIKALCASGVTQRVIAERFGISQSQVSFIHLQKRWRHVETA